jgi:hypothetical protein
MTTPRSKNGSFGTTKKYFQQARCCLGNLGRARNRAAPPRCQASIDRARRLPEARPPWRSPQGSAAAYRPIPRYTPCIVMSSSTGDSNLRSPGYGGARCNWRRAMRPMPPSRSSERRSFASTSSTSDLQHARHMDGGLEFEIGFGDVEHPGGVPVRLLGNVRDLSGRSDFVDRANAKIADESGIPRSGWKFP